ncbi:MAG: hypothetical protein SGCHY_001957 [Lobulomycetales sp.]
MAVHNIPEGVSVAYTTEYSLHLGISLCIAILLHNILEGMVVALPVYMVTRSPARVLASTFLNGLCEPLGVLLAWTILPPSGSPGLVHAILAGVAGVMTAMAVLELVPEAARAGVGLRERCMGVLGGGIYYVLFL